MRAVRGWIAVVCCVAALAGCGGDDDGGETDSGTRVDGGDAGGSLDSGTDECSGRDLCETAGIVCDGNTRVTCGADVDGCLVETRVDCAATGDVCSDADGTADCVDPCELIPAEQRCDTDGARSCDGDSLEVCAMDANGCLALTVTDCAATEGGECNPTGGEGGDMPVCVMPPDPCASIPAEDRCTTAGTSCEGNTLTTCAPNAFGCLVTTDTDCTSIAGGTCDTSGAAPTCRATNPCNGIEQCEAAGTTCDGPELVTCARNAFGCLVESRTTCTDTMFGFCDADAAPAAQCSTAASDPCMGVEECGTEPGRSCSDRSTLSVCAANAFGCYTATPTDCTAEGDVCDASGAIAVCVDPCTLVETCSAPLVCDGTAVVTCTADADGCLVETSRETCPTLETCSTASGTAECADAICPQAQPVEIDCASGTISGNTMGGTRAINGFCDEDSTNYQGTERIYRFRNTAATRMAVRIVSDRGASSADFDLFVWDGGDGTTACTSNAATCIDSSTGTGDTETIDFVAEIGALEYVAYDVYASGGLSEATTDYTLAVTCTPIVCGDGAVGPGETCDDGNTAAGDGCSPTCAIETGFNCNGASPTVCVAQGPNAVCSGATAVPGPTTLTGQNTAIGGAAPAGTVCGGAGGPTLYYDVTVPAGTRVTAVVTPSASMDAVVKTLGACAAPDCAARVNAAGTGAAETVTLENAGGAAVHRFLAVNATSGTGTFSIAFTHAAIGCGNGVPETGEGCDDGNQVAGDGCSEMCAVEMGYVCSGTPSFCRVPPTTCAGALPITSSRTLTGEDTRGGGAIPTATSCGGGTGSTALYYAVTIPAGGVASVRVTPTAPAASWDVLMFRLDACDSASCGATADSSGSSGVETMSFTNATASPVTRIFGVRGYNGTGGTYTLAVTISRCGDGVLGGSETCDDANGIALDGCSATCTVENDWSCSGTPSVCTRLYTREPITAACVDITGGSIVAGVNSDDTASTVRALPFAFSYFGSPVSHYSVTSNGYLQLWTSASGSPSTEYSNVTFPNASTPNGLVAAFWDDLVGSGTATELVTGEAGARSLVVQWTNWTLGGGTMTIQALLYENSNIIEFRYCSLVAGDARQSGNSATIGLENLTGTAASLQSFNTAGAATVGNGYRFTP